MASFQAQHWDRAAVAFAKVVQDGSVAAHDREMAEHHLGVSLYRLGFSAASRSLFDAVAENPNHATYAETFRFLAQLGLELPEAADLGAVLSRYPEVLLGAELDKLPPPLRSRVRYLLGRREYTNKYYRAAIAQFEQAQGSEAAKAQWMIAMCHVQMRKSVPAVEALANAEKLASAVNGDREARRLRDLAMLTRARIYFSAATRVDDSRKMIVLDRGELNAAIRDWSGIDASSDFATDAQWERAWGHFASGAHQAALAHLRSALSRPGAYLPEAEQLEALVQWSIGEDATARQSFQRFLTTYQPVQTALRSLVDELGRNADRAAAAFSLLQRVNARPDELPPALRAVVPHALKDRELLGALEYARRITDERRRLDSLPAGFRNSAAGDRARRALEDEHRKLLGYSGEKVYARLKLELAHLDVLLQEVVTAAERARD